MDKPKLMLSPNDYFAFCICPDLGRILKYEKSDKTHGFIPTIVANGTQIFMVQNVPTIGLEAVFEKLGVKV